MLRAGLGAAACAGLTLSWPVMADTSIPAIQGGGASSPLAGSSVTVTGIVTGDFQDGDANDTRNLGGFFIQSLQADADPATSEGLFVYDGARPQTDVREGQRVRVTGRVQEHYGETQLAAGQVTTLGHGTAEPATLRLPAAGVVRNADGAWVADLEAYEGMLVVIPQRLTLSSLRQLERFGEATLSAEGRLYQFTNQQAPGVAGYQAWQREVAARSLLLDDGRRDSHPVPVPYLGESGRSLRLGDSAAGLTGVLRYARGSGGSGEENWRLLPILPPDFADDNPRPAIPARRGSLRVASLNLMNYFSGVDAGRASCGPDGAHACRGADSAREQARQLAKIAATLLQLDADIVGLIELENNARDSLAEVVAAVNRAGREDRYAYVPAGTIGRDTIKTGLIYQPERVRPVGQQLALTRRQDLRFDDSRNRPAIAQTFEPAAGGRLTVVVNHLKSKGSDCAGDNDPNTGDGQGNCNLTRTRAMAALADWLAGDPTGSEDGRFLVIGDFNAYLREDPLRVFEAAGFVNLIGAAADPPYTFVYDAQSGALDHAFASRSLAGFVRDARPWHVNADEAPVHDYNLDFGRDPAIFDADTPWRSSDHDPIVVDLDLGK